MTNTDELTSSRNSLAKCIMKKSSVTLLGVSRQGRRFRDRVRKLEIKAGDVLLVLGNAKRLPDVIDWLGCLPLAERGLQVSLVELAPQVMGPADPEMATPVHQELTKHGIDLRLITSVTAFSDNETGL